MDKTLLYDSFYQSYVKANPEKKKHILQREANDQWREIKNSADLPKLVDEIIKRNEARCLRKKGTLMQFWAKASQVSSSKMIPNENSSKTPKSTEMTFQTFFSGKTSEEPATSICPIPSVDKDVVKSKSKVQDQLQNEIKIINNDLTGLYMRKKCGQLSEEQEKQLRQLEKEKANLERELKQKKNNQKRQQKYRTGRKRKMDEIFLQNPEMKKALNSRDVVGRPRLETDQSELLSTIIKMATHGSASHERRNEDILRTVKTLGQMKDELSRMGFTLSQSALYLRLLPKRSSTSEGKRHVSTVPVKLIKAQKDAHVEHVDGRFCRATINHLEEIASILGPNETCFLSQDDKARVPLGLTAANLQSPIIMHVEYKVILPDHDWVVAPRHKLIPSVYAGIEIEKNGIGNISAVGYSGPTYIAIRSGKHSSSTAYSHALDFRKLLTFKEFDEITKFQGMIKPTFIITVDGGPDENPRYQKVIEVAIDHFIENDLDALFIVANAPGRSAFNRVERRMAPLSKALSGLILPHEHFGSHLDSSGKTIDEELEKKNFEHCGNVLAKVWGEMQLDGFPTVAEYILPDDSEINIEYLKRKDATWFSHHVRSSQYLTQIVKCENTNCCSEFRGSFLKILPERFLSAPIPILQSSGGLNCPDPKLNDLNAKFPSLFVNKSLDLRKMSPHTAKKFEKIPYDLYCPSIQDDITDRICKVCHLYFASVVLLKNHKTVHIHKKVQMAEKKIRPVRIVAKRQRELMAVLSNGHYDWLDENYLVKVEEVDVPEKCYDDEKMSVIDVRSNLEMFEST